ncbi:MAG: DNA alkylation repair protein [Chloroflexi bacterium]|nr:DNA alkylation repair protein [Chloroflexota bacterium]
MDWIESERKHLLEQVEPYADPKHADRMREYAPTTRRVYGLRVADLRVIDRAWRRAHRDVTHEDLLALAEALWHGESREEWLLATLLLEGYKGHTADLPQSLLDRWRRDLENWEQTDCLGWVVGLWFAANPDARQDYLWTLLADEDVWSRRLALVTTARVNRGEWGLTIPDLTLQLVDQVKAERHPMITRAVSWALRSLITHHQALVVAYLDENRETLAGHVVREVNNKLRTGLKSGKRGS